MKTMVVITFIAALAFNAVAAGADRTSACFTHFRFNEYKDAIRAGEEAIRQDPSDYNAFICLALASENLKNYGRAINYWEKAIQRKLSEGNTFGIPSDYEAMARVYSEMGDKNNELKYKLLAFEFAERQKIAIEAKLLAWGIARMYEDKGEYEKSVQYYKKRIQYTRSPEEEADTHWRIAGIYAENLKNPAAAIEHAKIAIPFDDGSKYRADSLRRLAGFYALYGNYDLALQHYVESINYARERGDEGRQADGVCALARFYKANHKTEDAVRTFEDCIARYKKLKIDNGVKVAEKELASLRNVPSQK